MSKHRQSGTILALLCAVSLMVLLLPLTANAVTVTIYGTGGVVIYPPAICPDSSTAVCMTIALGMYPNPDEGLGQDAISGNTYRVTLAEPIPPGVTEMQGSDLELESIEPIE